MQLKATDTINDSAQLISPQDLALLRMGSKSSMLAMQLLSQFVKISAPEKNKDINEMAKKLFQDCLEKLAS